MKLFDDVGESVLRLWTKLEKKCPACGADLDIVPELLSKRFPIIKCEQCHLTLEVSTRNNYRMSWTIVVAIPLAFAFGLILHIFF